MTWSATVSVAALLLAIGKFVDSYHNRSSWTKRLSNWARTGLVHGYLFLSELRVSGIARASIRVIVALRFLFYVALIVIVTFVGMGLVSLAFFFKQIEIPFDWILVVAAIGWFGLFLVFMAMRLCLKWTNDIVLTVVMVLSLPFVVRGGFAFIGLVADKVPGMTGFYFALVLAGTYLAACIPIVLLPFVAICIVILKYMTLGIQWIGMKISDAASDPKNEPFTYFSALGAVIVLACKTIADLLFPA